MFHLDVIHKEGVTVSLLEYKNLIGRLLVSHDPTCITRSLLGCVESLKVFVVEKRLRYVLLTRSSIG